jgi:hypothetical protein
MVVSLSVFKGALDEKNNWLLAEVAVVDAEIRRYVLLLQGRGGHYA